MSEQHRNFRLLARGLDVEPAIAQLAQHEHLWSLLTLRQQYEGSAHRDTETIVLRGPQTTEGLFDNLEAIDFPALGVLTETLRLLHAVAELLALRDLGRMMLVRLKAGGAIAPHVDEGAYARYFARVHLALTSNPDCRFTCGEETVQMAPGELWWFNHQLRHSVANKGAARVHLIVDFAAPGFTGALAH